jgi:hypothetical protein
MALLESATYIGSGAATVSPTARLIRTDSCSTLPTSEAHVALRDSGNGVRQVEDEEVPGVARKALTSEARTVVWVLREGARMKGEGGRCWLGPGTGQSS